MNDNDQSSLILALKQRDRAAWIAVTDDHLNEVYGFVFHLVGGNRRIAEDLHQEIWLEAIHGIAHCDPNRGSFRNWLFGIARNQVALHYRRASSRNPASPFDPANEAVESQNGSLLPEDMLEKMERISVVRAAMLLMPEDRRQVLLWKYDDGLSVATIATRMGKTAKAIESLLSRSREQLRGLLGEYMMSSETEPKLPVSKESSYE